MNRIKPFLITLASMTFYYLALPPANLWFLTFIPPVLWVFLIRGEIPARVPSTPPAGFFRKTAYRIRRCFTSFYGMLYAGAFLFWGVSLLWLPSPHPAIWAGWFALSAVMALYFPLYIFAARRLTRRFHFPLILASPLVWVGTEWLRKHILTGFTFCSLEHALYRHSELIQTAEFAGEYGVGALILLIGTAVGMAAESFFFTKRRKKGVASLLAGAAVFVLMAGYGNYAEKKIDRLIAGAGAPSLKIALLQEPTYYRFPVTPELNGLVHRRYMNLSAEAAEEKPDLIVWPEGTFAAPFFAFEPNAVLPAPEGCPPLAPEQTAAEIQKIEERQNENMGGWVQKLGSPVLLGLSSIVYTPTRPRCYNSALLFSPDLTSKRYDKRARVLFGEYIPILENLPESFPLKTLCEPISAGKKLGAVPVAGKTALVSICYESCYSRFVRSQLDALRREKIDPDFLINISNDAWFFGGVENDFHASTYPFRAVETRRYYLVATHGGVSFGITPAGKTFVSGTKGKAESVTARFTPVKLRPFLNGKGLWFGVFCAVLVFVSFLPRSKVDTPLKNEL